MQSIEEYNQFVAGVLKEIDEKAKMTEFSESKVPEGMRCEKVLNELAIPRQCSELATQMRNYGVGDEYYCDEHAAEEDAFDARQDEKNFKNS